MADQQIIKGAAASHDIYIYVDGDLTDLDADPTYTITDDLGNTEATGTASNVSTGIYRVSVSPQSAVDRWTVAWSGLLSAGAWSATTTLEIVGAHLFTEAEVRAHHDSQITAASFSDLQILEARARITDEFEYICGVSFIPRYHKQTTAGTGDYSIDLVKPQVREVLSVDIGSTSVATTNFVVDNEARMLHRTNGYYTRATVTDPLNVVVAYEHGYESVPPDIKRAAIILARHQLLRDVTGTGVPANASSWTDPSGSYQAFAPNNTSGRFYGVGEVDTVLQRYMARSILI